MEGSRHFGPLLSGPAVRRLEARFRVLMTGEEVVTLMDSLAAADVGAWIFGGWGIDALVGRQTRPHADLDVLVADRDEQRAVECLTRIGYRAVERKALEGLLPLRTVVVLRDPDGRRVELQPIDAAALERVVGDDTGPGRPFASGTVAGHRVDCLSASGQEFLHAGYPQRARDHADMAHLRPEADRDQRAGVVRSGVRARIVPAARRRVRARLGVGPSALNIHVHELEGIVVAPHVTLVNPWLPANRITPEVIREAGELVAAFRSFDVTFERTGRFPGILYIAPEPGAPIVALVEAFVARWPDFPPYEGQFDTIIPHLTVAFGPHALQLPQAVAERLPLRVRASHVDLMAMGRNGRWTMRASLPLGD